MANLLILANQATAAKRRVYFHLVQTDGITAATAEAGGQPQISTDGAAWTNTGIGTLTAIGSGRYYADLTQAATNAVGSSIETRYKSVNTAECPGDSVRLVAFDVDATNLGLTYLDAAVSTRSTYAGGAVASVTGDVGGRVLGGGASAITGTGVRAVDESGNAIAPASTALTNVTWTDTRAGKLDNLDAAVTTRSTYAGADTAGTTTLLLRIPGTVAAQSGDAYARLGAPVGASVSVDLAAVKADTAATLTQATTAATQSTAAASSAATAASNTTNVPARLDAAVSTRLAATSYTAPDNTSAATAATQATAAATSAAAAAASAARAVGLLFGNAYATHFTYSGTNRTGATIYTYDTAAHADAARALGPSATDAVLVALPGYLRKFVGTMTYSGANMTGLAFVEA